MREIKFIAEISGNHNKDWHRIEKLIQSAKQCGFDAVKFQLFKARKLWHSSLPDHIAKAAEMELPRNFIPKIKELCIQEGLEFGCSVFDIDDVQYLAKYVDYLKIASYEFLWLDLINACVQTDLPIMISTGLCTEDEIHDFMRYCLHDGTPNHINNISLLHCVSNYPTKPEECNLVVIKKLKSYYGWKIGWSDHTCKFSVICEAVNQGAEIIEMHFDLNDCLGQESKFGHCWNLTSSNIAISIVKEMQEAIGSKTKQPVGKEIEQRNYRADPEDGLRLLKDFRND